MVLWDYVIALVIGYVVVAVAWWIMGRASWLTLVGGFVVPLVVLWVIKRYRKTPPDLL